VALPVGLLLAEASTLRFVLAVNDDYPVVFGFDILAALALLLLRPDGWRQRGRVLALVPLIAIAASISFTAVLPRVLGLL
jgi:hypothetical protein